MRGLGVELSFCDLCGEDDNYTLYRLIITDFIHE